MVLVGWKGWICYEDANTSAMFFVWYLASNAGASQYSAAREKYIVWELEHSLRTVGQKLWASLDDKEVQCLHYGFLGVSLVCRRCRVKLPGGGQPGRSGTWYSWWGRPELKIFLSFIFISSLFYHLERYLIVRKLGVLWF